MLTRRHPGHPYSLDDGLGVRRAETDGRVYTETLELSPLLAARPAMEEAIRGRAERFDLFAELPTRPFPGGRWLRWPGMVLGMLYFALRDRL